MKQKHSECGLNSCNYPECGCHLTKLRVSQKTDQVSMKTLRTPEDILSKMMDEEFPAEPEVKPYIMAEVKPYIFKLARIAQKESWNAAVRASAKVAKVKHTLEKGNPNAAIFEVDQDSILTLIEE